MSETKRGFRRAMFWAITSAILAIAVIVIAFVPMIDCYCDGICSVHRITMMDSLGENHKHHGD